MLTAEDLIQNKLVEKKLILKYWIDVLSTYFVLGIRDLKQGAKHTIFSAHGASLQWKDNCYSLTN